MEQNSKYSNSASIQFDYPTNDFAQLILAALNGLSRIFKNGFQYQRAGIMLPKVWREGVVQSSLFDVEPTKKSQQLMATLDTINKIHGKRTIPYGTELLSNRWKMRQQFKSPSYTTKINELLTISI